MFDAHGERQTAQSRAAVITVRLLPSPPFSDRHKYIICVGRSRHNYTERDGAGESCHVTSTLTQTDEGNNNDDDGDDDTDAENQTAQLSSRSSGTWPHITQNKDNRVILMTKLVERCTCTYSSQGTHCYRGKSHHHKAPVTQT